MFAVVSTNGKYHGHIDSKDAAMKLAALKENTCRLLTETEWQDSIQNPEARVEKFSTLGIPLN